ALDDLERAGLAEVDEVVRDRVCFGELTYIGDQRLELVERNGRPERVRRTASLGIEVEQVLERGTGAARRDLADQPAEVRAVGADAATDVHEVLRCGLA